MSDKLTTKQFWLDYWGSKEGLVFTIPENYPFINQIRQICVDYSIKSVLEIGGFPGYYSVWILKNLAIESTLLDYVVHNEILNQLELKNGLEANSVQVIETDLFEYNNTREFDLVVSNGLIEHFTDTKLIIQKHVDQLCKNGMLFITLPNFKSLNGWFQKKFDYDNYTKHNISCMDIQFLKKICQEIDLKEIEVSYNGKFMIWLEDEANKPLSSRILKKVLKFPFKVFFKIIPVESKYFSPYIIIKAKK